MTRVEKWKQYREDIINNRIPTFEELKWEHCVEDGRELLIEEAEERERNKYYD